MKFNSLYSSLLALLHSNIYLFFLNFILFFNHLNIGDNLFFIGCIFHVGLLFFFWFLNSGFYLLFSFFLFSFFFTAFNACCFSLLFTLQLLYTLLEHLLEHWTFLAKFDNDRLGLLFCALRSFRVSLGEKVLTENVPDLRALRGVLCCKKAETTLQIRPKCLVLTNILPWLLGENLIDKAYTNLSDFFLRGDFLRLL